ncbi:FtsK/SpoIIIE domain-containing protein [Microbacterium sp. BWT-B31]|uniref:FtsK/SpoIIIE domain-containing protein n=1 Tax=Microbacterium sp. BWT-B31 TaxID=3232072 RepID=UPI0035279487
MPASRLFLPRLIPQSAPGPREALSTDAPTGDSALVLPAAWTAPARSGIPLLASVVPMVGAVGIWAVTGSMLSLWLAALVPVVAVATMLDQRRAARRDRRRAETDAAAARARVGRAVEARHAAERARRWSAQPDVAVFLRQDAGIWRAVPERAATLTVGTGAGESAVRVTGGEGDSAADRLRARAAVLEAAPVAVPMGSGIAVSGPPVLAAAVVRALAVQLCLAHPPGELRLISAPEWADAMPHRGARAGFTLAVLEPGDPVPASVDVVIARVEPGHPSPPRCAAALTVDALDRARLDDAGTVSEVAVEGISDAQARAIAHSLADRAERTLGASARHAGAQVVALSDVLSQAPPARRGALPAVIGTDGRSPVVVDLVSDGPHAIVAGMTGAGKSELLVTWILALCAIHATDEVSFLLADFKGGTAFDALADVPHVTGVITDLDGAGARRAIESLRAEIRWREGELARAGARDVADPRVRLPRLVVVVDEFAALLGDHPELRSVFTDVAARGRALGLHLILGTQRVAGVVRDGLLANCPLRVSLRVADAADSRAVVGTDDAALLPGGVDGRGVAVVRRAGDAAPGPARIALSTAADANEIAACARGPRPRRPWLPDLPGRVELADLRRHVDAPLTGEVLVLGLADEPERQRQRPVGIRVGDRGLLVVGGPGSGRTTALRTIAAQAAGEVLHVPSDPERAWDAVTGLSEAPPPPGSVVVIDDVDLVAAAVPHDYGRELVERLDLAMRRAGDDGILFAVSAQRLTGAAARLCDMLPRRLILAMPTRQDHVAAGGDAAHHAPGAAPGRGRLDGRAVQVALADAAPAARGEEASVAPVFLPTAALTGFVARASAASRAVLEAWAGTGAAVAGIDDYVADPGASAGARVIVGDPEQWQRHWRVLSEVRADHDLVVDAGCAVEFRAVTGDRRLPPYCAPGRARAWVCRAGDAAVRVALPAPGARVAT